MRININDPESVQFTKEEWSRLCSIEPRLITLFETAKQEATYLQGRFDIEPNAYADKYRIYGLYKERIEALAGRYADQRNCELQMHSMSHMI